jgi:hypothetical protein
MTVLKKTAETQSRREIISNSVSLRLCGYSYWYRILEDYKKI